MWKCPPSSLLVPVDFGDASARALQLAAALAAKRDVSVRVLHAEAIETPPYFTHEQLQVIERERKAARAKAGHFLREFAQRHGVKPAEATVTEGSATAAIVEAARRADLVIMGTHGRRGPSRWWMGSVAERVVRESGTPVLVIRGEGLDQPAERVFERPVVVAPEGAQTEAMRVASGLAQIFGGAVNATARCAADLAAGSSTLVVVSKPPHGHEALFGQPVEQWLRSCALPMLFVPSATAAGV